MKLLLAIAMILYLPFGVIFKLASRYKWAAAPGRYGNRS